jgi:polyisoprenoid-binding protein YceI
MHFEGGTVEGLTLDLTINAGSLELLDHVSDADHREIEQRMREEALEASSYPEITYQASNVPAVPIVRSEYRLHMNGQLTLRGVTHPHLVEANLQVFLDAVRLRGECLLHLSDYQIKPVSALAGTIKLKDELHLEFDLVAFLEKS